MTIMNERLNVLLDADPDEAGESRGESSGGDGNNVEELIHQEHVKRLQAEAEAEAKERELAVTQTQFSEYLADKAEFNEALCRTAKDLEMHLLRMKESMTNGRDGIQNKAGEEMLGMVFESANRLVEELNAAAVEARATSNQVKAENENLVKRTPEQANLNSSGSEVSKRTREKENKDEMTNMDDDELVENENAMETRLGLEDDNGCIIERAKYIPLRLTSEERRVLRLLEGALNVSEYTDKVDVLSWRSKSGRITTQIKDLCAILCGLTVAQNFKRGQQLMGDRDFAALSQFFQNCFEIGRRFKTMNPEKLRDSYGKLIYMLMDSVDPHIQELLGFPCVRPLRTVYSFLQEVGAEALLADPLLPVATAEIDSKGRSRHEIQKDIRRKEKARDALAKKYRNKNASDEDLLWTMYSISDHASYLAFARDPVDRVIEYLKTYFSPACIEAGFSLAIQGGSQGARLTHSHERQYTFVLQSLTLWREIAHEMFRLWTLAECDMLDENNSYRLQNTGQGLQRVQSAPRVARAMSGILSRCQRRLGSWIGSSVVHLGDQAVPNALIFIDKYTQVPRILNPLVLVLDELPRLARDKKIAAYLDDAFGGWEKCRKAILCDFFRHAFDGSGADSFYMAGSCIDGRLTSAWNWGSQIEKKSYWQVFKLAGFNGFDGDFK